MALVQGKFLIQEKNKRTVETFFIILGYHIWYTKKYMLVISSREFRDNQKKYLDLVDNNQHIIIQRGKDKAYVLSQVSEEDQYFMDPNVKAHIMEGIADYEAGRVVKMSREERKKMLGL